MARDLEALTRDLQELEKECRELYEECGVVTRGKGARVEKEAKRNLSRECCCRLWEDSSVDKTREAAPTIYKINAQGLQRRNHYKVTAMQPAEEMLQHYKNSNACNTRQCLNTCPEPRRTTRLKSCQGNDAFKTTMFDAPTPKQQKQINELELQLTEMLMQRDAIKSQLVRYNGTTNTTPVIRHYARVTSRMLDELHYKIKEHTRKLNTLRSRNNL